MKEQFSHFRHHVIKSYRWYRHKPPNILNLSTSWRWVVNFMPHLLSIPLECLDWGLVDHRASLGMEVKRKIFPPVTNQIPVV
jgi:hypothetical protein